MTCPLCSHKSRIAIERALKERTIMIASGSKETPPTFDEIAQRLNTQVNFGPVITADQLKKHIACPPQTSEIVRYEDVVEPTSVTKIIVVDGEALPVYTPGEIVDRIYALGMKNIQQHPEQVKIGHLIQILKLSGDLKKSDDLVQMVRDLLQVPEVAPAGPQSPPGAR